MKVVGIPARNVAAVPVWRKRKRGEIFCFRRVMGAAPEVKQGWYSDTQYQQATPLDCHCPVGQQQPSGSLLGEVSPNTPQKQDLIK